MSHIGSIYLLPYIGSILISLSILFYAWNKRQVKGGLVFLLYIAGQSLTVVGFILEMVNPSLAGKIFWDKVQWATSLIAIITFPVFAVQYTETKLEHPRRLLLLSFVVPIFFMVLVFTDGLHHLIYIHPRLGNTKPFSELIYDFGTAVFLAGAYSYITVIWGLRVIVRRFTHVQGLYRTQTGIITFGFLIPVLGTTLALAGIQFTPQRDPTPFTAALADMIIAVGLFRFKLFEVMPVPRDRLFEAIVDPVVVLDNTNNVVDINASMLALLGRDSSEVIGEPAKQVFEFFPIPIKLYTDVSYAQTEATFQVRGKDVYYELTVWPLMDENKQTIGRIYISHDITAFKELERELRDLNLELEKRVRVRTEELAEAYDITLEGWAKALELRDKETEGHSRRVTETTIVLARAMNVSEEEVEQFRRGAILHDIGKMGIPDEILLKNGALTESEREIVRKHPETAYELLKQIPFLQGALDIPSCHHEKWDGTGYPKGLKGNEIPLAARIFAVADVWDALLFDRPYRKAWPREKVIRYLIEESGKHFDPRVINIFLKMVDQGEI